MIDIDFQAVVLPIVAFLTMVSVSLDLEVPELSRVVKNPRIAFIGTVIQTFTFPILALSRALGSPCWFSPRMGSD
jgi:predicted Na+-dependent transporter